ncbi:UNVERIFIED_CONTAM: hypothetical protein Sradi_6866900 [Sesamum radiatum]|uniref:RNase H type-1 domain-containing protein n=1 Tax=Sesamum radiatum TaxID=300843 RepID=A0AAW2JJT6_SESRA
MKIKFPTPGGVGEVQGEPIQSQKCYIKAVRKGQKRASTPKGTPSSKRGKDLDPEEVLKETRTPSKVQPTEELLNIFAWSPHDLEGIDPRVITHHLNIDPNIKSVKQKKRHFGPEKDKIIQAEVDKLMATGHIETVGEMGGGIKRIRHLIFSMNDYQSPSFAGFVSEIEGISLGDTPKIEKWLLHVDGSSTIQGSGADNVITSPQGEDLEFAVKFDFKASNNEVVYEALVIDMKMAHEAGARHLIAYLDSQLIVKQVEGT